MQWIGRRWCKVRVAVSCSGLRKQIDATSGPLVPAGDLLETRRTTASDGHTPVVLHSQLSAGPMGRSGQVLARAGPWARHVQHQPVRPVGHVPRAVSTAGNADNIALDCSQIVNRRKQRRRKQPDGSAAGLACSEQRAMCTAPHHAEKEGSTVRLTGMRSHSSKAAPPVTAFNVPSCRS